MSFEMIRRVAVLGALCACAAAAQAQSSVTMYGIVDAGLRRVDNDGGASLVSQSSPGLSSSRIGFRGIEDLGGGLAASFWLENQFNPDTGTLTSPTRFFHRRATVGLSGRFGEVQLGRNYTPTFLSATSFDPFAFVSVGAFGHVLANSKTPGAPSNPLESGAQTFSRANNSVTYALPPGLGGFYGQAMVAAGEGVSGNSYRGARIGYASGPFDVAVAYGITKVTPRAGYEAANIAGSYKFGMLKLMAQLHREKFERRQRDTWLIGFRMPIGASEIRGSYARANMKGPMTAAAGLRDGDDSYQLALGYVYHLSKRTALYASVSRLQNKGQASLRISGGPDEITAGGSSRGYEAGIRHSF